MRDIDRKRILNHIMGSMRAEYGSTLRDLLAKDAPPLEIVEREMTAAVERALPHVLGAYAGSTGVEAVVTEDGIMQVTVLIPRSIAQELGLV